jgi:hypothetical protein
LALPPGVLFPATPLIAIAIRPRARSGAVVVAPVLIALLIVALLPSAALFFEPFLLPILAFL